jgi:putative transcriptional regulator
MRFNLNIIVYLTFKKTIKMNRIKEVLESKGLTQTWLAESLGKSYNMVNSYAQNRRQPSIEVLYQIAKILNVEASDLLIKKKN